MSRGVLSLIARSVLSTKVWIAISGLKFLMTPDVLSLCGAEAAAPGREEQTTRNKKNLGTPGDFALKDP